MTAVPKAVLYYSHESVWSSAVLLALKEKGYGDDEVDLRQVDLSKGENFDVSYLRINPKAVVPTLVVPLENTLADDVESRYKAITEPKDIVEFLDKSRFVLSKTHTTSSAPAPSLAPATISFLNVSNYVIDLLHSEAADPYTLSYLNVYDEASLRDLSKNELPAVAARRLVLDRYLKDAEAGTLRVSDKVIKLWTEQKAAQDSLYDVLKDAGTPTSELDLERKAKREQLFKTASRVWQVDLTELILKLSKAVIGPFTLGDQFSVADIHLTAWLERVMRLSGVTADDDGKQATEKLAKRIGQKGILPAAQHKRGEREGDEREMLTKLEMFWDSTKGKESWKSVYGKSQ